MSFHTTLALLAAAALTAQAGAQPHTGATRHPNKVLNTDQAPLPHSPFQPDLTPGYVLIEGDIQIRLDEYLRLLQSSADGNFGGISGAVPVEYWPDGVVPFEFVTTGPGAVSPANQVNAINAMSAIAAVAGVTFRPAIGLEPTIAFQSSTFNSSPIGRHVGTQIINITDWGTQTIICHEIFHSLGFWHEQSRSDRGTYITINPGNICGSGTSSACTAGTGGSQCCRCADGQGNCISCAFNFSLDTTASHYGPYDFDSCMHYGRTAFSCNGQDTITVNAPWNAEWQDRIGQITHLSYLDTIVCRGLYPFSGDRWVDPAAGPFNPGTFLLPWNFSVSSAAAQTPSGGTLFLKSDTSYHAVGTYSNPMFMASPSGTATLGN